MGDRREPAGFAMRPESSDEQRIVAALEHGPPRPPRVLPPGREHIVAAGAWGSYGSVVALCRDDEDEDEDWLVNNVYLLARSPDGRWAAPGGSSGSGVPAWVLDRPWVPLPDWHRSHLVTLGAQMACVDGRWVAELTVMATWAVVTLEVRYGGDTITVPVPAGGLVTLPGVVRSVDDAAEFRGFDEAGKLRAVEYYRPLTDLDRKHGWPDGSLWD
jgi:hypothetical protein